MSKERSGSQEAALRTVITRTLKGFVDDDVDAVRWLHALDPRGLSGMDERRRNWWTPRENELFSCLKACPEAPLEVRAAALFLAGSDGNGHTREAALRMMRTVPSPLTLSCALLRCNDWVAEVRAVAHDVVIDLLAQCAVPHVLAAWPVAVRLRDAQRVDRVWLEGTLFAGLSSPANRAVLEGLLGHPDARTRLAAHVVALGSHPDRAALRAHAILDSDPHVSHLALADLLQHGEPGEIEAQCVLALSAPSSRVRSAALRALVEREVAGLDAYIETAAFDRSRGVRRLAAWLLQQRQATPAIALWRDELTHGRRGRWREALEALADHAEAEDVPALRALLPQVSPRHQRSCLRGWVRAEGGVGMALLREALEVPGRTVQALLASASALWAAELDPARLLAFCHDGPSPVAQAGLLAQLTKLPLWQHLDLLLDAVPQREDERAWHLRLVQDWLRVSGQYSPLGTSRRQALVSRLEEGRHALPHAVASEVLAAVRRA
ncbi:HEAT repeat domain-containing protein [Stenotrophomonas maltophilia]|uniref:HEAT repeat domain-containing protein n=1 Tax=Stenotrophomonas maltophilia TaxID=40324 RepID=UPI0039F6F117